MNRDIIIDEIIDPIDIDKKLASDKRKFIIRICVLIVFNTLMFTFFIKGNGIVENFKTIILGNLIGYNILGFILGAIVAVFPYKGLSYQKKYVRASLLTIFVFHCLMAFCLLFIASGSLMGWY